MLSRKEPRRYEGVENRVQLFALALALAFGALLYQFWQLQVVRLSQYQEMAEDNRVRNERLKSDRGIIFGRDDTILADNRASTDIVFVPGEAPKERRHEICMLLEEILGIDGAALYAEVQKHERAPFEQIPVKRDVSRRDAVRIEELQYKLEGVLTIVHPQRRYIYGETAGQILGYLGEISQNELDRWDGYHLGDLVGKTGLERMYESLLHGRDGYAVVTKYAWGRPQFLTDRRGVPRIAARDSHGHLLTEEAPRAEPVSGRPLYLTLDIDVQREAERLLRGQVGAIAVLDADTGAVFALASSPGYDPSVFVTRGLSHERLKLLEAARPNPMRNRCYVEHYPPGSVFKVLLAIAALEEGVIDRDTTFFCPGFYQIDGKGRRWHCHKRGGHGHMSVVPALALSCDVFFYNVGRKLGIERINEWCRRLGLGVLTGIDLPGEIPGLIPSPEWKEEVLKDAPVWDRKWFEGDTVNVSIGQGSAATTPLQNAVLMASVLNGGRRVRPFLNREIGPQLSERYCSDETLAVVTEGMRECVGVNEASARGTGRHAYIAGMAVIGKTGSAQIMALEHHKKYASEEDIPYEMRDHAWFIAGVVDRQPRIAVSVLIEHGHHGGTEAAPVAKSIIEYFYAQEAQRVNQTPVTLAQQGSP